MTTKLLSFLGTGTYGVCTYTTEDGRTAPASRYMACTATHLYSAELTTVLMTTEARTRHWDLLMKEQRDLGLPPPTDRPIPSGKTPEELWEVFDILKEELRWDKPRESTRRRLDADDTVVLDITHGFRSQPFFAASVVSFLRSLDSDAPMVRIVYGAWDSRIGGPPAFHSKPFEPKDEEPTDARAPIWDLTPFVDVLDWTSALQLFLKTGSPAGLGPLHAKAPRLVRALTVFGEDLVTGRTGSMLLGTQESPASAREALLAVKDLQQRASSPELRPLLDILDKVSGWLEKLDMDRDSLDGEPGRAVLVELARLYLELHRYFEVFGTVREGLVSAVGVPETTCPGRSEFDHERRRREEISAPTIKDARGGRNDLMHMGYQPRPMTPAEIRASAQELVEAFSELDISPRVHSKGAFVNLSTVPSGEWEEGVRSAAMELANTDRITEFELRIPDSIGDVDAVERWLRTTVNKTQKKCRGRRPKYVFVQLHPLLCVPLVRRLQMRGFLCVARPPAMAGDGGRGEHVFQQYR